MNLAEEQRFECPVCFLLPEQEVYQCEKGHVLCHNCSNTLQQCPQRRVSIAGGRKYRNLFMEETLDKLRIDCEFKDKGCDEKLKRTEVTAHSVNCEFGKTVPLCELLGFSNCDFKTCRGSLSEIIPHLEVSHGFMGLKQCEEWHPSKINISNFFQLTQGKKGFCKPIKFDKPRDKMLFVVMMEDGYVSWFCFDLNEEKTLGLKIKISSLETPSMSMEVPFLRIMDAEQHFDDPPTKIRIPFLDLLRKETNPLVEHMNYQIEFS